MCAEKRTHLHLVSHWGVAMTTEWTRTRHRSSAWNPHAYHTVQHNTYSLYPQFIYCDAYNTYTYSYTYILSLFSIHDRIKISPNCTRLFTTMIDLFSVLLKNVKNVENVEDLRSMEYDSSIHHHIDSWMVPHRWHIIHYEHRYTSKQIEIFTYILNRSVCLSLSLSLSHWTMILSEYITRIMKIALSQPQFLFFRPRFVFAK